MVRDDVWRRYRGKLLMHIHLLYRLERISDLAPLLTATDTVILMDESMANDPRLTTCAVPCDIKVLRDHSLGSEHSLSRTEWVELLHAHCHWLTWH